MIIENFRETADNDAGGWADDGRGKLAMAPHRTVAPRYANVQRYTPQTSAEQVLLDHIVAYVQSVQPLFPRSLIADYYTALMHHPLVFVASANSHAAAELARLFAEALVGAHSNQIALISGADWHEATGENGYYRTVHGRFSALRFQSIAQEAADPSNLGKAYFVCFDSLAPHELIQQIAIAGALIDLPHIAVSAAIRMGDYCTMLKHFPQAAVVEVHAPALFRRALPAGLPPVGYQRMWLRLLAQNVVLPRHYHDSCESVHGWQRAA